MKIFYLSKSTINFIIVVAFLLLLLFGFYLFLFFFVIVGLFLFLFRRKLSSFKEDQVTTRGSIYAPVTGKVIGINKISNEVSELSIRMGLLSGYGIYLPISARVNNVIFKDKDFGTKVTLEDSNERKIRLYFINSFFKRDPELIVLPGDLGRRQVDIGFYPFGATVKMQVENSELLVAVNEKVRGGETIVGRYLEE